MTRKAQREDIKPGRRLWLRDHNTWLSVVVVDVYWGGHGPKVAYRRADGTRGKQTIAAFYQCPAGASPDHALAPRPDSELPSSAPLPPGRVAVETRDGRPLSPCTRDKARALVGLGLALWIEPAYRIRLTYDLWAGSRMSRRVIQRDHGMCTYCGQPATSVDHLLARSQGGLTQPDNLVAACHRCNQARGDRPLEMWLTRHPAAAVHPVIATYLTDGGTPTHRARVEALFADGIPDPNLCADSNDARQWIKRYRQHHPDEWARWMQNES